MDALDAVVNNEIRLPSPPGIALRILETIRKDDFTIAELGGIIQSDPALTARVLRLVNSPLYALRCKVSSIELALSILGAYKVKNIALSFTLFDGLRLNAQGVFDFNLFWKRSVTAAVAADLLAGQLGARDDDTFITALLQDIGVFVIYSSRPDDYSRLLAEKKRSGLPIQVMEERMFGFDHQQVGAEVLRRWGLPGHVFAPIRHHHDNDAAPEEFRPLAGILRMSDMVSSLYNGSNDAQGILSLADGLAEGLGVSGQALNSLIDLVAKRSGEAFAYFEIVPDDMKSFSLILQEANEELFKLSFSYESSMVQLQQENMVVRRSAAELEEANRALREISFRDGLTGLYNRRYLNDYLLSELGRAARHESSISLIMFDIDHFKKVNDIHGHLAGDMVLKAVSGLSEKVIRESDVLARYGGEEFVIVLPETGLDSAMAVAERLRVAVERMSIMAGDQGIRITISAGVASRQPWLDKVTAEEILRSADLALYSAKNSGRNRVAAMETLSPPGLSGRQQRVAGRRGHAG